MAVSFLGIHQWEPDIYVGFSSALHLHCTSNTETLLAVPPLKRETLISPLARPYPHWKYDASSPLPPPLKGEGTSEVLTLSKRIIMSTWALAIASILYIDVNYVLVRDWNSIQRKRKPFKRETIGALEWLFNTLKGLGHEKELTYFDKKNE
jgi:hypothetical protein